MARTKVTLGDVAREAGVSTSTASEALSGRGRMTDATRQAVRDTAQRLGYRPNALARGLRTGRTHAIALHHMHAADHFASEYFREFVAGVLDVTRRYDYDLTLLSSDPERPRAITPQVDGVIIADPIASDLRALELLSSGLPVVAGERYPPGMPDSPVIGIAHEAGLVRLLDHAYSVGARRPILFAPDATSGWGVVLHDAFLGWCAEHDLPGAHCGTTFQGRRFREEHGDELVRALTGPDAADLVVVSGEHAALAAIEIAAESGRKVGRDLLVGACADARLLRMCEPPVSAVRLEPRSLGAACAEALIRHLDADEPLPDLTLLEAGLELRESTRALRSPGTADWSPAQPPSDVRLPREGASP